LTDALVALLDKEIAALKAQIAVETETFLPFRFVVSRDEGPGVVDDVAEAVRRVEAQTAAGNRGDRIFITRSIKAEVEKALGERHPKRFSRPGLHIVARIIVRPGDAEAMQSPWQSEAGDPLPSAGIAGLPEVPPDPIEKAADRLQRLRDGIDPPSPLTHWQPNDDR
jgi:hypothetical protein